MRRKDFIAVIEAAEYELLCGHIRSDYGNRVEIGVCMALYRGGITVPIANNAIARLGSAFIEWMTPDPDPSRGQVGVDGCGNYWLGKRVKRNLQRRLITLELFKQFMLSEELFKDL